jgi:hypothetical protein
LANPPRNRKEEDIGNSQRELLDALGGHASGVSSSIDELRDAIAKELEGRRVFVIVDDVWAPDGVQAFSIHAGGSAILLTSRRARDFKLSGISVRNIELLNELEGDELFRAYANIADNVALDELQRKILGGLPPPRLPEVADNRVAAHDHLERSGAARRAALQPVARLKLNSASQAFISAP